MTPCCLMPELSRVMKRPRRRICRYASLTLTVRFWRKYWGDRSTDGGLERLRVDLLSLTNVTRAPWVSIEARIEERGRVFQRSPLGKAQLHFRLARLAGADDSVMRLNPPFLYSLDCKQWARCVHSPKPKPCPSQPANSPSEANASSAHTNVSGPENT